MLTCLKSVVYLIACASLGFLFGVLHKYIEPSQRTLLLTESKHSSTSYPADVLGKGNGIILLEISDRMNPPPLVLCSIESAARVYPERPVAFFMKGLPEIESSDYQMETRKRFPVLSAFENIYFFPLRMDELYADTPLLSWYTKVNPAKEIYWIHVNSDGCRFASIWKYGGIYMDTDIISMRPIPYKNFLAAETESVCSSSVFGLDLHHDFTWTCMEDFVQNYNGDIWGHQGPALFTRVMKEMCGLPTFRNQDNASCGNITYLHHRRLYPIAWRFWKKYFEVWKEVPTFDDSYALHLWSYMNSKEKKEVVPGSNTLIEHLFKQYCPNTYASLSNSDMDHH